MKTLQYDATLPTMPQDLATTCQAVTRSGALPEQAPECIELKMCQALYLLNHKRYADAGLLIDTLNYEPTPGTPLIYRAWLWLARMSIYVVKNDPLMAADAAEQSLQALSDIAVKRGEDFLAVLAALLYNLAAMHNEGGESVRAAKELTKAQKLYERLVKKNPHRFATMLTYAVEASTVIFTSRNKQLQVFAHYQELSEQYTVMASEGNHDALHSLVDTLTKEGDIMMQMGNSRDAVKYYTKALRWQKRLGTPVGKDQLRLSIALAKALMRKTDRRDTALQLLHSLQPLALQLGAKDSLKEIDELLNAKNRNSNIMTLLKGIF
ncbi:MAG: hypothetical protein ACI308_01575 [Muribaculaceae bacterium]